MKIVFDFPPNIEDIRKVVTPPDSAVFTYGNTIYNPGRGFVSGDLMEHERTHMEEQGDDPDVWWKRYLSDVQFRLTQEVKAYRRQYEYYRLDGHTRNDIALFSFRIAKDLAGPMYGNLLTVLEAQKLIINGGR